MSIYLEVAIKQIEKGIVGLDTIKSNLTKHYLELDKQEWTESKRAEYDVLYPTYRNMTENEKVLYLEDLRQEDETIDIQTVEYPKVEIDYSEDESYLAFNDWLQETKTVLIGTETATDDDGVEYEKEIFEEQRLRVYTPNDVSDKVNEYLKPYEKEKALKEIEILEFEALRPTQELLIDSTNEFAKTKLANIETKLKELRAKL